jgi:hypothetical protein
LVLSLRELQAPPLGLRYHDRMGKIQKLYHVLVAGGFAAAGVGCEKKAEDAKAALPAPAPVKVVPAAPPAPEPPKAAEVPAPPTEPAAAATTPTPPDPSPTAAPPDAKAAKKPADKPAVAHGKAKVKIVPASSDAKEPAGGAKSWN